MTEIHRGDILKEAHDLTTQDRNKQYGPPEVNLNLAGELKEVFWRRATRQFSHAEHEAIDMALTKLSRIGTGTYKKDNYVDGAAYIAIAGQMGSLALVESGVIAEPKSEEPPFKVSFGKRQAIVPEPRTRADDFIQLMEWAKTKSYNNVAWDEMSDEEFVQVQGVAKYWFFQPKANDHPLRRHAVPVPPQIQEASQILTGFVNTMRKDDRS